MDQQPNYMAALDEVAQIVDGELDSIDAIEFVDDLRCDVQGEEE